MSMESTTNEPKSLDPSVDSRSQLELDTSVDNKKEENFCKVNGNDSVIENDGDSKSDATNEVNAKVGLTREDSGSLISVDCASCDQLEIGPERKDNAIAAEALKDTTSFEEFTTSEESELNPRLSEGMDNLAEQHQASMDTPIVAESKADYQTFEILSKQWKYGIPQLQVDAKDKAKFDFVRDVLELSGLSGHDSIGTWHSDDQPIDPSVYEEIEGCLLLDPDCSGNEESGHCNHMLLFDLINEVLVEIYGRSYSYCPMSLSSLCSIRLMPAGNHVLREVWSLISWYLSLRSEADQPLDYVVSRDLAKGDGWMNLQFETECVGLELEDLIIDDLLEEFLQE
ncbi:Protein TRM32 [Quillaja saponaria]|uniref:Protein TRM32 n=1 Tax=Quillaja saponaria TaxID=32244 RepID=A0AAD7PD15_QUISA|nr:Protein TRM32 [Quillaja saponaria]